MVRSGLYDRADQIYIGSVGSDLNSLKKFLARYSKPVLKVHYEDIKCYEFQTLEYLYQKSQKDNHFIGVYFHTKGVSWPGHEGGAHWRDYMNYYNITRWRDAFTKVNGSYDTCGVKLIDGSRPPAYRQHYSGNFFWFKSAYIKKLKSPLTLNLSDRYSAEMWVCSASPVAASLCQKFVDYNTKGKFKPMKIYVHTLAFNLPSEVAKTTKLIHEQNKSIDFKHIICDLGFPLLKGDEIPTDLNTARQKNTIKLKELCQTYGSSYTRFENIGVSQNWTQVIKHCKLNDDDVIIGADPDERTMDEGWVEAMAGVLQEPGVGMVSLMMPEQLSQMKSWSYTTKVINGAKAIHVNGTANWAMIGFKGEFLKKIGGVMPYPDTHPVYGYIETFVRRELDKHGYKYLFLPDFRVYHTDYPKDEGAPRLLREWKNQIILNYKQHGQMDFDKYLNMRKKGQL
jgi:hypothetical protein